MRWMLVGLALSSREQTDNGIERPGVGRRQKQRLSTMKVLSPSYLETD
jgi:hypothetical protein